MKLKTLAFAAALAVSSAAQAQGAKLKVGLMLPATGTFAALGTAIENGFRLYVTERGGKLAGREIEFVKVDDESDPAKATDNVNKLIKRDQVDVLVGTVHSGVALAMVWESSLRLLNPVAIEYHQAMAVAVLGLLVNLASAWFLHDSTPHSGGHGHDHPPALAHHHHAHGGPGRPRASG